MRLKQSEGGQAIILFVGIFSVILVMAAIVVDFGLWFAERRSAQRGADLAAAAGAQDLPLSPGLAFTSACAWADANGFDDADGDIEVLVKVFQRGGVGLEATCESIDVAEPTPPCGTLCDTVRVTVSKGAPRLFTALPFFELPDDINVGAEAVAGLTYGVVGDIGGTSPDQTIVLVDAQGRMNKSFGDERFGGRNCQSHPQVCPIRNEQIAAVGLIETLLGLAGNGEVGYAAFNNCYGPTVGLYTTCLHEYEPDNVVIEATRIIADLRTGIDATDSIRGQPANICTGLWQAEKLFSNGIEDRRVLVLFSDGSNVDYLSFPGDLGDPPSDCFPSYPTSSGPTLACTVSAPAESELDYRTLRMATILKGQGVDIYVVALNPCPWAADPTDPPVDNSWPADCGRNGPVNLEDNDADQRLLMCIATSPEHYQRVNNVAELPDIIEEIAAEIVSRSLLQ